MLGRRLLHQPSALLLLCLALLFVPPSGDESSGLHVFPSDVALAGLIALVVLRLVLDGTGLDRLRSALVLPLAAVLTAGGIATLFAVEAASSLAGWVRMSEIFVLGPLGVAMALRTRRQVAVVLAALVAFGAVEGALGVVQYATGSGASYGGQSVRAVGTFGSYDIMGMATSVRYAIAITAGTALCATGRLRMAAVVATLALLPPLALSLSRGAALAAVVSILVMALSVGWRQAAALVGAGLLSVALLLAVAGGGSDRLTGRFSSIASSTTAPDQSVQDRYALWSAARRMLADSPITGIGIKGFQDFRDSASPLNLSTGSDVSDPTHGYRRVALLTPHDLYFLLLAEQGVLGGLAYAVLFASLLIAGWRRFRRTAPSDRLTRGIGLCALGCVVSYLMDSIYSDIGGASTVLMPIVLGIGLWWAMDLQGDTG